MYNLEETDGREWVVSIVLGVSLLLLFCLCFPWIPVILARVTAMINPIWNGYVTWVCSFSPDATGCGYFFPQ